MQKILKDLSRGLIAARAVDDLIQAALEILLGIVPDTEIGGQADLEGAAGQKRLDEFIDGLHLEKIIIADQRFHDIERLLAGGLGINADGDEDVIDRTGRKFLERGFFEEFEDPGLHLKRRLIGERDGQDVAQRNVFEMKLGVQQKLNIAFGQGVSLAGTSGGLHHADFG